MKLGNSADWSDILFSLNKPCEQPPGGCGANKEWRQDKCACFCKECPPGQGLANAETCECAECLNGKPQPCDDPRTVIRAANGNCACECDPAKLLCNDGPKTKKNLGECKCECPNKKTNEECRFIGGIQRENSKLVFDDEKCNCTCPIQNVDQCPNKTENTRLDPNACECYEFPVQIAGGPIFALNEITGPGFRALEEPVAKCVEESEYLNNPGKYEKLEGPFLNMQNCEFWSNDFPGYWQQTESCWSFMSFGVGWAEPYTAAGIRCDCYRSGTITEGECAWACNFKSTLKQTCDPKNYTFSFEGGFDGCTADPVSVHPPTRYPLFFENKIIPIDPIKAGEELFLTNNGAGDCPTTPDTNCEGGFIPVKQFSCPSSSSSESSTPTDGHATSSTSSKESSSSSMSEASSSSSISEASSSSSMSEASSSSSSSSSEESSSSSSSEESSSSSSSEESYIHGGGVPGGGGSSTTSGTISSTSSQISSSSSEESSSSSEESSSSSEESSSSSEESSSSSEESSSSSEESSSSSSDDGYQTCPTCSGSGSVFDSSSSSEGTCPTCHGTGRVPRDQSSSSSIYNDSSSSSKDSSSSSSDDGYQTCPTCSGSGSVFDSSSSSEGTCPTCHGTGRVPRDQSSSSSIYDDSSSSSKDSSSSSDCSYGLDSSVLSVLDSNPEMPGLCYGEDVLNGLSVASYEPIDIRYEALVSSGLTLVVDIFVDGSAVATLNFTSAYVGQLFALVYKGGTYCFPITEQDIYLYSGPEPYGMGFTAQPQDKTLAVGEASASMFSVATFGPVQQYMWQHSVDGGLTYFDINPAGGVFIGADTATLGINAGMADTSSVFNGAKFRCKISNGVDTQYSNPGTLTVVN